MIKKNWKRITIILLAVIVVTSVVVYADYVKNATNVTYQKDGNTVGVNSALDDLYAKATATPKSFTIGQLVKLQNDPVATDEYYVLNETSDTVDLFAKTNLNTSATKQANEDGFNTACVFSSSKYWGSTAGLNLNLEPGYITTDVIGKARSYAKSKGAIDGRLLTLQEVKNLTGISNDNDSWSSMTNTDIKDMINGAGNTTQQSEAYWLGTTIDYGDLRTVYGTASRLSRVSYNEPPSYGVRPVITVEKSRARAILIPETTADTTPWLPAGAICTENRLSEGITIQDASNNEWTWVVVPKSVTASASSIADGVNPTGTDLENALKTYAATVVTDRGSYTDTYYSDAQTGLNSTNYNDKKRAMLNGIKEYGGFWIGKYEVGSANVRSSSNTGTADTPLIQQDKYPYTYVTCSEANTLAMQLATQAGGNGSLLFGTQWDLTLKYLVESGAITTTPTNQVTDSTDWGNHKNKALTIPSKLGCTNPSNSSPTWTTQTSKSNTTGMLLTTGAVESVTNKRNIVDLAGNVFEWTMEYTSYTSNPCAFRGGSYNGFGSYNPASYRISNKASNSTYDYGFRPCMYAPINVAFYQPYMSTKDGKYEIEVPAGARFIDLPKIYYGVMNDGMNIGNYSSVDGVEVWIKWRSYGGNNEFYESWCYYYEGTWFDYYEGARIEIYDSNNVKIGINDLIKAGEHYRYSYVACLASDTLITIEVEEEDAKGRKRKVWKKKPIKDITYDDNLVVWNFDEGKFDVTKPLWIAKKNEIKEYHLLEFSDGRILKTIKQHRIFNKDIGKFTYPMREETPIGTNTFTDEGKEIQIVNRKVVKENIEYCNIISYYHMNVFANGILTSCRLSNLYKIENMKYVKDNRPIVIREEYKNVPDEYYYGLRLAEQPREVNRGTDNYHTNTLEEYVINCISNAQEKGKHDTV